MKKKHIVSILIACLLLVPNLANAKTIYNSKIFNLKAEGKEFMTNKELHNGTVMQSLAFDSVHKHTYIVQLMAGGQQLPGEDGVVSGAMRNANGDLTLTKLDENGNKLGYMFLKGFGHGVQIGVEVEGSEVYLWTETDSVREGAEGWGTKLARFQFQDGAIFTPESLDLTKYQLIEGADRTTVTIDPVNNLLTMRYRLNGEFRFALYHLEDIKQNHYQPIADIAQPDLGGTFQGFASLGRYLYLLQGNSYGSNGSTEPIGNTYITSVDFMSGQIIDKQLFTGGSNLSFREPEGLAIRIPNTKTPHKAQLSIGFASDFTPKRLANIYYLDHLIQPQTMKNHN